MSPEQSLFREQALAHHLAGDSWRGDLLRISPLWSIWAFGFLMLAIAGGLLFAAVTPISEYASGPAIVYHPSAGGPGQSGGMAPTAVLMLIPAHYGERVAPGAPLLFTATGSRESSEWLVVNSVSEASITLVEASQQAPAGLIDAVAFDGPMIMITASLPERPSTLPEQVRHGGRTLASFSDGLSGDARILLGSEQLLWMLLRPFRSAGTP